MKEFLDKRILECRERRAALTADCRGDEADMEKIRANIYEVFRTVLDVAEKQPEPKAFFFSRLAQIPGSWQESLDKALAYGDEAKAAIERIKLAAAEDIRVEWEARA